MSSDNLADPTKKLDKVVATFMDAVTKQIEAQTQTYKQKMNRYEKSISILYSALNMISSLCPEYSEALVEIAKNRRLLAVNKKHLRGQWRQDAIEVDRINLKQLIAEIDPLDRKEQLEEKGLNGEVKDLFIDYKEEALRTFVDLLETKTEAKLVERITGKNLDQALQIFALEYAECRGNLNKEQAFFYLALYQFGVSR
jgi:tetratricopeptide (TPR) repeat protein